MFLDSLGSYAVGGASEPIAHERSIEPSNADIILNSFLLRPFFFSFLIFYFQLCWFDSNTHLDQKASPLVCFVSPGLLPGGSVHGCAGAANQRRSRARFEIQSRITEYGAEFSTSIELLYVSEIL